MANKIKLVVSMSFNYISGCIKQRANGYYERCFICELQKCTLKYVRSYMESKIDKQFRNGRIKKIMVS